MISRILQYSFAQGKTKALKGMLLSSEDWYYLLRMGTLDHLLRYLSGTHYARALSAPGQAKSNVRNVSMALYNTLFRECAGLGKAVPRRNAPFLKSILSRYDAENLKTILRGIRQGRPPAETSKLLYDLGSLASIPVAGLLRVRMIPAAVDLLEGTLFHRPLTDALPQFRTGGRLFLLEMAVDRAALEHMAEAVSSLEETDRQGVRPLVGEFIDTLNLSWLIRLIHYYGLSPEETINYTLSGGLHLTLEDLGNLARSTDLRAFVDNLPAAYRNTLEPATDWPEVERLLKRRLINQYHGAFSRNPFQLSLQVAYLFLKEAELEALCSLVSALHMGVPPKKALGYISPPVREVVGVQA